MLIVVFVFSSCHIGFLFSFLFLPQPTAATSNDATQVLHSEAWHIPLPLSSLKQWAKNVRDGKENDMMTKLFPLLTFSIAYSLFQLLFHFFNGLTMLTLFPLLFQFSCCTQEDPMPKARGSIFWPHLALYWWRHGCHWQLVVGNSVMLDLSSAAVVGLVRSSFFLLVGNISFLNASSLLLQLFDLFLTENNWQW